MSEIESLKFLNPKQVREIAKNFGTPVFVYSQAELEKRCDEALAFPCAFGLTVRYAMKANSNSTILKIFKNKGICIDASSEYEVHRALAAGFLPSQIMLTSQELTKNLKQLVEMGVQFNACSLRQLEVFGRLLPTKELSIRFNPGTGSGGTLKTTVAGKSSSFGVWYEDLDMVMDITKKYDLKVSKIHTHIGSGTDPDVWMAVADITLEIAEKFIDCETLSLGGGFKVARMMDEKSVDFQKIGAGILQLFSDFKDKYGRRLKFEIEPGTYMVANCGAILSQIDDMVSTGKEGYEFIKVNTGMDTNTRPSLYGSRHPLVVVPFDETTDHTEAKDYVVVGHCCESGDLFTQKIGGEIETRKMLTAFIGDYVVMEGTGAYCSSMSTKNYNSYPESAEVLVDNDGISKLIRKRQTLEQMIQNELD